MKISGLKFVVALVCLAVCGCASEVVPSSGPRAATDPAQIKFYETGKKPQKYEVLGMVEVPVGGSVHWDAKGDATAGFEQLKAKAAALGANGILLTDEKAETAYVIAGYNGAYYQVPVRGGSPSVAVAQAIYVLKP